MLTLLDQVLPVALLILLALLAIIIGWIVWQEVQLLRIENKHKTEGMEIDVSKPIIDLWHNQVAPQSVSAAQYLSTIA
jgi:lysophospholipid acyltransferase (LPLAT)-like uncharacterized protein